MAALQYVNVPGYSALLLRRTFADLNKKGALMDRMREWLSGTAATWNEQTKTWRFPSGATVSFGYLDTENDKYKYQGAEFQFCVAVGTPVLMADGSYKAIELVQVGDEVATLIGPRRVTHTPPSRLKQCVAISTGDAAVTVSDDHRVLTPNGWVAPRALRPIRPRGGGSRSASSALLYEEVALLSLCLWTGLLRKLEPAKQTQGHTLPTAACAVSANAGIDFAGSGDALPAIEQPQVWNARLILLERARRPGLQGIDGASRHRAHGRGQTHQGVTQGSSPDCHDEDGLYGEPPRLAQEVALAGTPSPAGVASCFSRSERSGGLRHTRGRSLPGLYEYRHPYTMVPQQTRETVSDVDVRMAPVGEREVRDLRVEEASHFILSGGVVVVNCGFDEISQFAESQYTYLFSRLRRLATSDIPIRMRSASNPGGVGANWVRKRFIPDNFTPGQSLDLKVFEIGDIDPDGFPVTRAFVPARMEDNPHLDQVEYRQSLNELDTVTREQLLAGDWTIQERGNIYPMWDERYHVITKSQFERVFGQSDIPNTWQLGVGHDVGFTEGHPYIVSFVATSPENTPLPGRKFLYRELCGYEATAREIGQRIKDVMTVGERDRVRTWLMSHEAASERAEYSRVHGLHFSSWRPDKNGGISQVRDYLELQSLEQPHPFKLGLKGQPWFYILVPDDQLLNPTEERGMARHRAEFPVYRYATLRSGDEKTVIAPHALFNDAMDALRGLASEDFSPMLRLSPVEVAVRSLRSQGALLTEEVLAQFDEPAQSVAVLSHMQALQRELRKAESDFGPIFNPRLRSGDQ